MRARARDAAASPAPGVPACPSCWSGRGFLHGQELLSPPVFLSPLPNPCHIFHFKPNLCPSHHHPDTSGGQREGLNHDTGPDAPVGGSKGNHLLLFQPDRGHVPYSCFLGGDAYRFPHPRRRMAKPAAIPQLWGWCPRRCLSPDVWPCYQVLIAICTSMEPPKILFCVAFNKLTLRWPRKPLYCHRPASLQGHTILTEGRDPGDEAVLR